MTQPRGMDLHPQLTGPRVGQLDLLDRQGAALRIGRRQSDLSKHCGADLHRPAPARLILEASAITAPPGRGT